jgi:hypothetical protein
MTSVSVTTQDFVVARVQVVAFPTERQLPPNKVIATLLTKYADRFNGDLLALPLPQDIPAEVPRAILQSSDQRFRFEIALSRLSSQWQRLDDETTNFEEVVSGCIDVLQYCVNELTPRVGRLALVVTRVCPCEAPAQTLIQRFCRDDTQQEPFNRSSNFEIHNHKEYVLPEIEPKLTINSWVRCKTASLAKTDRPAILVEQDLNTLAQENEQRQFTADQIRAYFKVVTREADDILRKYFPG